MKTILERSIPDYRDNEIFAPIRDKLGYIRNLVSAIELLLLPNYVGKKTNSQMRLITDKMNRLFFYRPNKYFSISFPFYINIENEDNPEINTYSGKEIDFENISAVKSILDNEQYKRDKSLIDLCIDPESIDIKGISLLEEFLLFEPCYVRYDYDPIRQNGKIHPPYHLDINYSQYGSIKIGLNNYIDIDFFQDFHNVKTDCLFLQ